MILDLFSPYLVILVHGGFSLGAYSFLFKNLFLCLEFVSALRLSAYDLKALHESCLFLMVLKDFH